MDIDTIYDIIGLASIFKLKYGQENTAKLFDNIIIKSKNSKLVLEYIKEINTSSKLISVINDYGSDKDKEELMSFLNDIKDIDYYESKINKLLDKSNKCRNRISFNDCLMDIQDTINTININGYKMSNSLINRLNDKILSLNSGYWSYVFCIQNKEYLDTDSILKHKDIIDNDRYYVDGDDFMYNLTCKNLFNNILCSYNEYGCEIKSLYKDSICVKDFVDLYGKCDKIIESFIKGDIKLNKHPL